MENMQLCSVLNSLPLPAFSFSSGKWRSYIAFLLNDFVTFKWKSSLWNSSSSSSSHVTPWSSSSNKTSSLVVVKLVSDTASIVEENEVDKVVEKLRGILWKSFNFYLKVNRNRTDGANISCPVTKLSDIDYADESKRLLSLISTP